MAHHSHLVQQMLVLLPCTQMQQVVQSMNLSLIWFVPKMINHVSFFALINNEKWCIFSYFVPVTSRIYPIKSIKRHRFNRHQLFHCLRLMNSFFKELTIIGNIGQIRSSISSTNLGSLEIFTQLFKNLKT